MAEIPCKDVSSSSGTLHGHSPKGLWVAKVTAGGGLLCSQPEKDNYKSVQGYEKQFN